MLAASHHLSCDGFKMLKVFLKLIQPSKSSLLLDAARDLGNFHMIDATALNGADLDRLMVLRLLVEWASGGLMARPTIP